MNLVTAKLGSPQKKPTKWNVANAIMLAALTACTTALTATAIQASPPGSGYELYWSSQFNGNTLNPLKWGSGLSWSNVPPTSNSYSLPQNLSVSNNTLTMTAQQQNYYDSGSNTTYNYTTGSVNTENQMHFSYGYIEATMKMPATVGTWPAFWMLQNGWPPEIDIAENPEFSSSSFYDYQATYHYTDTSTNSAAAAGTGPYYTGTNLTAGFNTYGVQWTPNNITFYFDNNAIYNISSSQANLAQSTNMYLLLDLAVGGWPRNPPAGTTFPASMEIQNVNVWQMAPSTMTMNWAGTGTSNWNSGSSWQNGNIPTLGSETAVFGQVSSSAVNVQWSNFQSVGNLTFNGGSTNYTLGQTGTTGLMLANQTQVSDITANAYQGKSDGVSIDAELELLNTTNIINNMSTAMLFYGNIYGAGALSVQNGTVILRGQITNTGGISADNNGTILLYDGSINSPTENINLSTSATSNAAMSVVGDAANIDVNSLSVGGVNGRNASYSQSAGTVGTQTAFTIGESGNAYGRATITGGTLNIRTAGGTAGDLLIGNSNSSSGELDISGIGNVQLLNNSSLTLGAQGTSGNGTVNQSGGAVTFFSDNATTSGGTGAVILGRSGSTGVYTYNLNGGILETPQIESYSGTSNFNFNGGTLKADESNAAFMQGLSSASIGTNGGTINPNGFNITIGQNISGTGALTITGGGTLTLSGNNTYSGGTTITGTTLLLANTTGSAAGSGAITLGAGGVLDGTGVITLATGRKLGGIGTVSSPLSTASHSTLSPGAADPGGTLTIANTLTIGDGTNLDYYFIAPSASTNSNSLILVSGTTGSNGDLTLGKDVTVSLQSGTTLSAGIYQLIAYSGQLDNLSNNFSGWTLSGFNLPGMTYNFSTRNTANSLDLVVSAVPTPEPATLLLLCLGGVAVLMRRKKQVKSCFSSIKLVIQNQNFFFKN